jgi:hypothetical protein
MPNLDSLKKLVRLPFEMAEQARLKQLVKKLEAQNLNSNLAVTRPGGPAVSLTSHGKRINTVHLTIESIASGSLLPSELNLWLDDEKRFRELPESLERLKKRGLSVNLTNNYGPHTKYYPFVDSRAEFATPMVTADDDILYPESWLKDLAAGFASNPNVVHCHRARVIALEGEQLAPYRDWALCESTAPAWHHFLNGVSGVIYPPKLLAALKAAGTAFVDCCPKADDVWLHAIALRENFPVVQLTNRAMHFPIVPGSDEIALFPQNIASGNDLQIKKTYTESDIQRIAAAARRISA